MSEKELREIAHHGPGCWVGIHGCICGLDDALEDKPDIAMALQLIDKKAVAEWESATQPESYARWDTLVKIAESIAAHFHIRLVGDDGWEYTE